MRQILIVSNNEVFQAERRRRHGDLPALAHDQLPATASILVGKRPLLLGGGPTSLGYVMRAGAAIGTIRVSADEARLGALTVK